MKLRINSSLVFTCHTGKCVIDFCIREVVLNGIVISVEVGHISNNFLLISGHLNLLHKEIIRADEAKKRNDKPIVKLLL